MAKIKKKKHFILRFLLLGLLTFFILFYALDFFREKVLQTIYPIKYVDIVEDVSDKYDIDKYLIYSVIRCESKFKEDAKSDVGAKGLMQLMDETAIECNEKGGFGFNVPENIYLPEVNIKLGVYYLDKLIDLYDGDISLAITAYNSGSGNVLKWLSDSSLSDGDGGLLDIPFQETKDYVDKVLNTWDKYKEIYGGIDNE